MSARAAARIAWDSNSQAKGDIPKLRRKWRPPHVLEFARLWVQHPAFDKRRAEIDAYESHIESMTSLQV